MNEGIYQPTLRKLTDCISGDDKHDKEKQLAAINHAEKVILEAKQEMDEIKELTDYLVHKLEGHKHSFLSFKAVGSLECALREIGVNVANLDSHVQQVRLLMSSTVEEEEEDKRDAKKQKIADDDKQDDAATAESATSSL